MARKPTMKDFERSAADRRGDKSGAHGKEGSAKDLAADKRGLAEMRAKSAPKKKGR